MENKDKGSIIDNKYLNSLLEDEESESHYVYYKNTFIYGWGKNKYGELGLGHTDNIPVPSPIKSLQNVEASQVCSGGKHTIILTNDGRIFVCGTDVLGLLGFENKKWKEQHKFQIMSSLDSEVIYSVSCAEFHSLCLAKEGYVYTWGGNLHNKLGQTNQAGIPSKLNALLSRKITSISCGDYHSVALADSGEVFSWGGGGQYNRGQCGHGDLRDQETPKRIEFFKGKKVSKIQCGGYHSIALTHENSLYGFGKGEYGQLGYGSSEDSSLPKLIKFSKKCIQYEKLFVKQEMGENLTLTNLEDTMNNTLISSNFSPVIKDFKCGGEHTVVLSSFGRVYTFGHGYTGQLGLGNTKNFDRPMIVKSLLSKTVNQIAAGWSHTMVLSSEGNVYVTGCGLNDFENRKNFTLVRHASLLNVTNIYAGGHHSWLVTDSIAPERNDFESPSPLGLDNFPANIKSNENSPRNLKSGVTKDSTTIQIEKEKPHKNLQSTVKKTNSNIKFNMDLIGDKFAKEENLKTFLHVAYTDLKMCHRFVRFSISKTSNFRDVSNKDLEIMFNDYFKDDPGVTLFRLQDDKEVNFNNLSPSFDMMIQDFKSDLKILNMHFDKKSYSLTILYDPFKNQRMRDLKSNIESVKKQNDVQNKYVVKSICKCFLIKDEVVNICEEDIKNSQIEEIMSSWVYDFKIHFSKLLDSKEEDARFIELRPNCFYI